MRLSAKSSPVQDDPYAPLAGIMGMAASMAQEISGKWPFAAARLRLELSGAGEHRDRQAAVGRALTLGLSGIVNAAADARKVASVFALQEKMMAVRLAGRKLVAFHPDRDVKFSPERSELPTDRARASVWSANGKLLGRIERFVWPRAGYVDAIEICGSHNPGERRMVSVGPVHPIVNATVTLPQIRPCLL